jgi:hypothetical protein
MTISPLRPAPDNSDFPQNAGRPPMMQWLAIADLVVDDEYQREIKEAGEKNITRIAESFEWAKFSPVIVTPTNDGKYAVIDGQHRSTAAKWCGFEKVPCYIVMVSPEQAAQIFAAVNGNVTKVSTLQIFKAQMRAGTPEAADIGRAAAAAGVKIYMYPLSKAQMTIVGQTTAIGIIQRIYRRFGEAGLTAIFRVIMGMADGQAFGAVGYTALKKCEGAFGGHPEFITDIESVLASVKLHALGHHDADSLQKLMMSRRAIDPDINQKIRDLKMRKFSNGQIAAQLRVTYAEVEAVT